MATYKQDIKDMSRDALWEHSILSLTSKRQDTKILKESYVSKLWDYIYNKCKYTQGAAPFSNANIDYLNKWMDFSESLYGNKKASELRIIYFAGPEPENDIDIMIRYGVRIENIWAIESEEGTYQVALESARRKYPMLKLYKGKIDEFLKIYPLKFDIIYLDFTRSLISEFKTIHNIFDNQSLAQLGALIINTTQPDKDDATVEFLSKFLLHQNHIEVQILEIGDQREKRDWFGDNVSSLGFCVINDIKAIIADNFDLACSYFNSLYPMAYASSIAPLFYISKSDILVKKIFADLNILKISSAEDPMAEIFGMMQHIDSWEYFFDSELDKAQRPDKTWSANYNVNEKTAFTRAEIGKLISNIRNFDRTDIYNKNFLKAIVSSYNSMKEIESRRFFCDVLFPQVLIEMFINQMGFTYHPIISHHKRHQYTAKTRTMMCDVFLFDQCRSLYDWLPMIEFYDSNIDIYEKQMIMRSCLDIFARQYNFSPINLYSTGVSLTGMGEVNFLNFVSRFPERTILKTLDKL